MESQALTLDTHTDTDTDTETTDTDMVDTDTVMDMAVTATMENIKQFFEKVRLMSARVEGSLWNFWTIVFNPTKKMMVQRQKCPTPVSHGKS